MASSFDSPKLNLHIGDGFEFMKKHRGEYDVIITDSSDPIGKILLRKPIHAIYSNISKCKYVKILIFS